MITRAIQAGEIVAYVVKARVTNQIPLSGPRPSGFACPPPSTDAAMLNTALIGLRHLRR